MSPDAPLRQLAAEAGIALAYHDVFGRRREPSAEVLRELLTALEVLPEPGADAAAALAAWQGARAREILSPVQVVWERSEPTLRLMLPQDWLEQRLDWELVREDGSRQAGAIELAGCRWGGQRRLDGALYHELHWPLPPLPPPGYHRLRLLVDARPRGATTLIVAPRRCYQPPALREGGRLWGPALQLYALRSERNWGIGDFTDLRRCGELWREQGADLVGLNPLHALFLGNPAHASPYSPSSRRFLNPLYLDVEAIADFDECEPVRELVRELVRGAEFQARLQRLRDAALVDYPAVASLKLGVLEQLFRHFRTRHLEGDSERGRQFRDYQRSQGKALRCYALFEALYAAVRAQAPDAWGWQQWPEPYRQPDGPGVAAFAETNAERIEFFEYLQWQTELQLAAAAEALRERGMEVGLYLDLAVSVARGGADCWRNQGLYASGVSIGAPPDDFNHLGQDWGLPPLNPLRLRASGYGAFIGALRENMSWAGALRIDHVMGLMRLFWIPHGRSAAEGAYVLYPFEDLLGIVALESQRNRCLVIGEDLGTVPPEVRAGMQRVGMLSYRVLYFEQDEHGFKPPAAYPAAALATVSTHDLPTLSGYWQGQDIVQRDALGLFGSEEARAEALIGRARDRSRLLLALEREGLLPEGMGVDPQSVPEMRPELCRSVHVYLARAPAWLLLVQPEDVLGQLEQANLPGSREEAYPNWRRKLGLALEQWPEHADFLRLTAALRAARTPAATSAAQRRPGPAAVVPRATYRLQLNADFTFRDAAALVPYLAELGISHVYCSPFLRARAGSRHGYDITDHNALNPEIGTEEDFERLCQALAAHDMGLIMDVVPNHMGVMYADNAWWLDVLENGPASLYAPYFDIDWRPAKAELRDRLLLPVLGGAYGDVLERGELALRFAAAEGAFSVHYYEHRFPIAPESYPALLLTGLDALELRADVQQAELQELRSLASAFQHLPGRGERDADSLLERQRDVRLHKQRLARLCAATPAIAQHLQEVAAGYNGRPGEPESFDRLHALLEQQAYRLAHWQTAADEINYRRFFDIHDLAALRMEEPRVFESTHQLTLRLVREGKVTGLRIDHPDGLYDPHAYFLRLQERAGGESVPPEDKPLYLVVEKILAPDEALPQGWPVHGTTGYDFLALVNGLQVDASAGEALRRFYQEFTGERTEFALLVYQCKRLIMKYALASELQMLAFELNRMSEADRHTRDFTLNRLRQALLEMIAWLPVYRTYQRGGEILARDRRYIEQALEQAARQARNEEVEVYRFLRSVLLRDGLSEDMRARADRFVMKLQQYTGAVMAKGLEDTAFYRHVPLLALNEVGGTPSRFGVSVAQFHRSNRERQRQWPHTMLATSSHDNKRSEDVRARLNVLSELGEEWQRQVLAWAALAEPAKRRVNGALAPSRNDEYLLYQTLLGVWPLAPPGAAEAEALAARVEAYLLKAVREAKQHTSWVNPDPAYEQAVSGFVRALLTDSRFLAQFLPFQQRCARLGLFNGLSQTLLKLTAPGVPDIYQGNELWDFSLVDPDNRRPVDYARRMAFLAELAPPSRQQARALLAALADGRSKLAVIRHVLSARRRHETLFRDGAYLPLATWGQQAEHLVAFARRHRRQTAVVLAPRLYARLLGEQQLPIGAEVWGDTRIELDALAGVDELNNSFTGAAVAVEAEAGKRFILAHEALADFPVALLIGQC